MVQGRSPLFFFATSCEAHKSMQALGPSSNGALSVWPDETGCRVGLCTYSVHMRYGTRNSEFVWISASPPFPGVVSTLNYSSRVTGHYCTIPNSHQPQPWG